MATTRDVRTPEGVDTQNHNLSPSERGGESVTADTRTPAAHGGADAHIAPRPSAESGFLVSHYSDFSNSSMKRATRA